MSVAAGTLGVRPPDDREFAAFQRLLEDVAGIHLTAAKKPLLVSRLSKRLVQRGMDGYGAYLRLLGQDAEELQTAIDSLTTNETFFFREPKHFEFLRTVVSAASRARPFRIWSAACSSGEEAYSIAMVLADVLGDAPWEIFASDLSTRVLDRARRGQYPMEQAQHIPAAYLKRFCLKGVGSQEGTFRVDGPLRERVRFAQINLNRPLPDVGVFDVIFLRNVMIYFDVETKRAVIGRLLPCLRPGGHLLVGHAESLHGVTAELTMVRPSIYRKS